VTVTTARECTWSVVTEVEWISIASAHSGQGEGSFEYVVASNPTPATRRGDLIVGDERTEIVQAGAPCDFTLSSSEGAFLASGGQTTVTVTTLQGCQWTAASDHPWITVASGASGDGAGTVVLAVAPNAGPSRTGSVTIATRTYTVAQGAACSDYSLDRESWHVAAAGGSTVIRVSASPWCGWTASSNDGWVVVASGASSSGSGSVTLNVGANQGPPRNGFVTIAGRAVGVTQDASCWFSLSETTQRASWAGGLFSVVVSAPPWCSWTAASNVNWMEIRSGHQGTGSGVVTYEIARHFGLFGRNGTLTIAGETLTVNQTLLGSTAQ
jgi:trimeric autotransporter adhesin